MSNRIEDLANGILSHLGISKIPIPIKMIAKKQGLQLKPYKFEGEVSGMLLIKNNIATIGYNPLESDVRQRFTIAHELGHYLLHKSQGELFVDKKFKAHYRDKTSATGEIKTEMQANAFAATILMPEKMIKEELAKSDYDFTDESQFEKLANKFNVSTLAMTYRLANLRIF